VPRLKRPGGVEIHWEERGEGPSLVIAHNSIISRPANLEALIADLSADHRVVTWDPRGTGQSSREGPFDPATDARDIEPLVEAAEGPVVTVSVGFNSAPLKLVAMRPEVVDAVVLLGALPQLAARGDEAAQLFDSDAVAAAMLELMRRDPRALLRTMTAMGNPQLSDDEVRQRLEAQVRYCPPVVAVARGEASLGDDARHTCTELGARLWIVHWENPMSPGEAVRRISEALPEAHLVQVDDGPISRPDLTAGVIRKITAALTRR
jgi:pimeloyl-ACP methyl ester carboxylesterase